MRLGRDKDSRSVFYYNSYLVFKRFGSSFHITGDARSKEIKGKAAHNMDTFNLHKWAILQTGL